MRRFLSAQEDKQQLEYHWTPDYLFESSPETVNEEPAVVLTSSHVKISGNRFQITRIEDFESLTVAFTMCDWYPGCVLTFLQLSRHSFVFLAGGLGWFLSIEWPEVRATLVPTEPIKSFDFNERMGVAVLAGDFDISIVNSDGAIWTSPRVSHDGIANLSLTEAGVSANVFCGDHDAMPDLAIHVPDWKNLDSATVSGGCKVSPLDFSEPPDPTVGSQFRTLMKAVRALFKK